MKKASEYRMHAPRYRDLARQLPQGDQRDQLLEMARTWEKLVEERSDLGRRHPDLAKDGKHHEKMRRAGK